MRIKSLQLIWRLVIPRTILRSSNELQWLDLKGTKIIAPIMTTRGHALLNCTVNFRYLAGFFLRGVLTKDTPPLPYEFKPRGRATGCILRVQTLSLCKHRAVCNTVLYQPRYIESIDKLILFLPGRCHIAVSPLGCCPLSPWRRVGPRRRRRLHGDRGSAATVCRSASVVGGTGDGRIRSAWLETGPEGPPRSDIHGGRRFLKSRTVKFNCFFIKMYTTLQE